MGAGLGEGGGYRAVDRRAYHARRRPTVRDVLGLVVYQGFAAALATLMVRVGEPAAGLLLPAFLSAAALLGVGLKFRRRETLFVVDAPGIYVGQGVAEGDGAFFAHWETLAGIVLYRAPGKRAPVAVGLRPVTHPDVVWRVRHLGEWVVDRTRLEIAIGRFEPRVRVTEQPVQPAGGHVAAAGSVGQHPAAPPTQAARPARHPRWPTA
jgi:hypothetical protein